VHINSEHQEIGFAMKQQS